MIGDIMRECRNFFESGYIDGTFTIEGNELDDDRLVSGQFIAVTGSTCHDGVYRWVDGTLEDAPAGLQEDQFNGRVWLLNVPPAFVKLAEDAAEYEKTRPSSACASESFGGYSHSMVQGKSGVLTWQEAFAQRLAPYRRMFTEVRL